MLTFDVKQMANAYCKKGMIALKAWKLHAMRRTISAELIFSRGQFRQNSFLQSTVSAELIFSSL